MWTSRTVPPNVYKGLFFCRVLPLRPIFGGAPLRGCVEVPFMVLPCTSLLSS